MEVEGSNLDIWIDKIEIISVNFLFYQKANINEQIFYISFIQSTIVNNNNEINRYYKDKLIRDIQKLKIPLFGTNEKDQIVVHFDFE